MKKTILTMASCAAFFASAFAQDITVTQLNGGVVEYRKDYTPELSLDLIGVSASVGYESEYVFRGEKRSNHAIQSKLEFSYPIYSLDVYAGAWYSSPIRGTSKSQMNELDAYVGAVYYMKDFRFDVGCIYYWYPDNERALNSGDGEVYAGVSFDTASYLLGVNVSPSLYYYYNWTLEQHTIEASFGYSFALGQYLGDNRFSLPIRFYFGYLTSDNKDDGKLGGQECDYYYFGGSADIAFAITEYCTISVGVRYSQREGGDGKNPNDFNLMGSDKNIWAGGKVDFGF